MLEKLKKKIFWHPETETEKMSAVAMFLSILIIGFTIKLAVQMGETLFAIILSFLFIIFFLYSLI